MATCLLDSDGKIDNTTSKIECPVCLDYFEKPIKQCLAGHSFCSKCIDEKNVSARCPVCRGEICKTRNYNLEDILELLPLPCPHKTQGCKFTLTKKELVQHASECKNRLFKCQGKEFCNWDCKWNGYDILSHFKSAHVKYTTMEFATTASINYNDTREFKDLHIISAHHNLFWYKHKIDVDNKKAYWAFQFIGPRKNAQYYYYEFEIYTQQDNTRKFKITDYCTSDAESIHDVFKSERCVVLSLEMLKSYVNDDNSYSIRFRLLKKKKLIDNVPDKPMVKEATRNTRTEYAKKTPLLPLPEPRLNHPLPVSNLYPVWLPHVSHQIDNSRLLKKKGKPSNRYRQH